MTLDLSGNNGLAGPLDGIAACARLQAIDLSGTPAAENDRFLAHLPSLLVFEA